MVMKGSRSNPKQMEIYAFYFTVNNEFNSKKALMAVFSIFLTNNL